MASPVVRPFFSAIPGFVAGSDTPRDFLERCVAEIEAREPEIKAFVALNIPGARAAADRATERYRAGKPLSPVDGMPVGIKDIIETIDMPTEQGSPIFTGWRSGRDGASVAALREAGAVVVGKTVTTEFAATVARGTHNPWDLKRTPGGSSSGSAASVGCGMLPAALGTQVIGSILRPASYCGVYGFKPSFGAINRGGSYDYMSQSATGVLAASLEDAWLTLREISARCGGDPGHPGLAGPRTLPAARKPQRLALLETEGWTLAEPQAVAAFENSLGKLSAAGIEILTRKTSPDAAALEAALNDAVGLSRTVNCWETRWPLNTYSDKDHNGLSTNMQDRLAEAEAMTQEEYWAALSERTRIRAFYAGLEDSFDGCITLAAPGIAPIGLQSTGNPVFVVPATLLGVPALSLPVLEAEGLPLGLQIIGFAEQDAAAVATAIWVRDYLAQH